MSMMTIACSGAQAAKIRMNTTAMNLANLKTAGYSRQHADQSAVGPVDSAHLSPGGGVQVERIRRISSQYLTGQVRSSISKSEYYKSGQTFLTPMESLLGNSNSGLAEGIDKFFATLHGATTQPDNNAVRQAVINEAQAMATRFNSVNDFIKNQHVAIRSQRENTVLTVNALSKDIASYNSKIADLEATGSNSNTMRDQRDELVKKLSGYMDVKVLEDSRGNYKVSLSNGETLVSGSSTGRLSVSTLPNGSQEIGLAFAQSKSSIGLSCGGKLGAINDYENTTLKTMQSAVSDMAENMAREMNQQLAKGFDLQGHAGKPLFVFNAKGSDDLLQITQIKTSELALSDKKGATGNDGNLLALIALKNKKYSLSGATPASLGENCASMVSAIGITSRQNQSESTAADDILQQAESQRDGLSGVNMDEEAINLQDCQQEYQANMKVIATGNRIFSDLLALF
ncbi:flagellar hook-associated protein FlgK [Serratia sp. M24T3]|uniref:flagellar hook-associated protein FlgK n=1 Tax=Serratia sp. M24T3 TaxID=932213 RepID=UPI00025B93D8|nr:flagellar hook-associated protein FlgK [Serratia sp. M24T3]EIC83875.1 flagellar hook-associated protein FlgK [Serratia sp. M24T3]